MEKYSAAFNGHKHRVYAPDVTETPTAPPAKKFNPKKPKITKDDIIQAILDKIQESKKSPKKITEYNQFVKDHMAEAIQLAKDRNLGNDGKAGLKIIKEMWDAQKIAKADDEIKNV